MPARTNTNFIVDGRFTYLWQHKAAHTINAENKNSSERNGVQQYKRLLTKSKAFAY